MTNIDQTRDLTLNEITVVSGAKKLASINLGGILGVRIYDTDGVRLNLGSLYIRIGKDGVTTGVSTPAK
jgi:hypothetical protein